MDKHGPQMKVTLETEPAFAALGVHHVAAGINNKAWFYEIDYPQDGEVNLLAKNSLNWIQDFML